MINNIIIVVIVIIIVIAIIIAIAIIVFMCTYVLLTLWCLRLVTILPAASYENLILIWGSNPYMRLFLMSSGNCLFFNICFFKYIFTVIIYLNNFVLKFHSWFVKIQEKEVYYLWVILLVPDVFSITANFYLKKHAY